MGVPHLLTSEVWSSLNSDVSAIIVKTNFMISLIEIKL